MALLNQLDHASATQALTAWLAGKLPDAQDVTVHDLSIPQSAGMSMTTILFAASWTERGESVHMELVARVAPPTPGVFMDPDLEKEFTLLKTLGENTSLPLPKVRWYEGDRSVLGSEFLIVDRAYGDVPADDPPYVVSGWVLDLEPGRRGRLYERAIDVVAAVADTDWRALGLGELLDKPQYGAKGIDQQLGYWEEFYRWASRGGRCSPTVEAALEWAKANKPQDEELTLNWGDARIGNIMYVPEDLSVAAVLDWEMAAIASPEMELGWLILLVRYYSEGIGVPIPEGLPTGAELIAAWERATGRTARHVAYYEAFAALRLSILMVRAGNFLIAAGAFPPDHPMPVSNPASQTLARLLGLPSPQGDSTSFVDAR
ncbi:MAG: phosphotransferase family protein [Mycobacterium sp.]|nr:phosphotransferase family protein [Mycobacterium sp.]